MTYFKNFSDKLLMFFLHYFMKYISNNEYNKNTITKGAFTPKIQLPDIILIFIARTSKPCSFGVNGYNYRLISSIK